jgi:hypothetical protein
MLSFCSPTVTASLLYDYLVMKLVLLERIVAMLACLAPTPTLPFKPAFYIYFSFVARWVKEGVQ